jgi:hypothetical protein
MTTRRDILRNSTVGITAIMVGGLRMTSKSYGRRLSLVKLMIPNFYLWNKFIRWNLTRKDKKYLMKKEKGILLAVLLWTIISVLWGTSSMAIGTYAATCMYECDTFKVYHGNIAPTLPALTSIASIETGWAGVVVGVSDQSFAGWEVAIGDADNDGKNEILTGGCPDSKLDIYKYSGGIWSAKTLGSNFADFYPGMIKNVRIADLNNDGQNEVVLGTGCDGKPSPAKIYVLKTDGNIITKKVMNDTGNNESRWTHGFGIYDIDGDGVKEMLSAYCGSGEIFRWSIDSGLTSIQRTKIYQNSGSGEDAMITDIDNDGHQEFIESDCYRTNAAYVRIFKFDASGTLIPYLTIDGYNGHPAFQCTSTIGDIDNDGQQELIVQWKRYKNVSKQTIIAYKISGGVATPICTIADEDPDLDSGISEDNCYWVDADNDGMKELYISTRGEELIPNGNGYARVLRFKINSINPLSIQKDIILDFNVSVAESCWINIGDVDNDGLNEIAVATGKGSRLVRGTSYMVVLKKNRGIPK